MISTVTSSTISTISTVTGIGLAATIGAVATLALIALLVTKELAGASTTGRSRVLARFCDFGIVPLTFAFGIIVIAKVIEILA